MQVCFKYSNDTQHDLDGEMFGNPERCLPVKILVLELNSVKTLQACSLDDYVRMIMSVH